MSQQLLDRRCTKCGTHHLIVARGSRVHAGAEHDEVSVACTRCGERLATVEAPRGAAAHDLSRSVAPFVWREIDGSDVEGVLRQSIPFGIRLRIALYLPMLWLQLLAAVAVVRLIVYIATKH